MKHFSLEGRDYIAVMRMGFLDACYYDGTYQRGHQQTLGTRREYWPYKNGEKIERKNDPYILKGYESDAVKKLLTTYNTDKQGNIVDQYYRRKKLPIDLLDLAAKAALCKLNVTDASKLWNRVAESKPEIKNAFTETILALPNEVPDIFIEGNNYKKLAKAIFKLVKISAAPISKALLDALVRLPQLQQAITDLVTYEFIENNATSIRNNSDIANEFMRIIILVVLESNTDDRSIFWTAQFTSDNSPVAQQQLYSMTRDFLKPSFGNGFFFGKSNAYVQIEKMLTFTRVLSGISDEAWNTFLAEITPPPVNRSTTTFPFIWAASNNTQANEETPALRASAWTV